MRVLTAILVAPAVSIVFAALLCAGLSGPALAQSGSFGTSVVIDDGELIVAEPNNWFRQGLVYVYRKAGDDWREAATIEAPDAERADGFGTVLARTGGTLFVGQRGGRIHIFERQGTGWRHAGMLATDGITGADAVQPVRLLRHAFRHHAGRRRRLAVRG
jgi:hypothetical protein